MSHFPQVGLHTNVTLLEGEPLSIQLHSLLLGVNERDMIERAQRISMNLRHSNKSQRNRTTPSPAAYLGVHPPVELHLERSSINEPWQVIVMASFGYDNGKADVDLYFNLKRGWVYHPECDKCNLLAPSALAMLSSFCKALAHHIQKESFDELVITPIRYFDTKESLSN
jgi:hypothetical protein